METVVDDKTGFLCEQTSAAFAEAMRRFIDPDPISADHQALQSLRLTLRQRLGKTGKSHVQVSCASAISTSCCSIAIIHCAVLRGRRNCFHPRHW